jgi:hypothetical protein
MTEHTEPDDAPGEAGASRLDRRAAMKAALGGAAAAAVFSAPRIEGFSVAPGYAAMATPLCVNPTLSGWAHAHTPTTWQAGSGSLGLVATPVAPYAGMGQVHLVEADPPAGNYPQAAPNQDQGTATATSATFTLGPWSTYTFSFNFRWRDHTTHVAAQRLEAQYLPPGSSTWTTGYTFTTTVGSGTRDVTTAVSASMAISTTAATAGTYRFRFRHSFVTSPAPLQPIGTAPNARGNDIAVATTVTVTCV